MTYLNIRTTQNKIFLDSGLAAYT